MQCRKPRTVGFQADGKTLSWSQKSYSKEYPTFQLPCGYCLPCRLRGSGDWATRALHESSIFDSSCFITLTYADPHVDPAGLRYDHFQTFMKDLRNEIAYSSIGEVPKISFMATGEYGSLNGRPHWHACIFGWSPSDAVFSRRTELGHAVYTSNLLGPPHADAVDDGTNRLWNYGKAEFGSVTYESASYISRYATKDRFGELDESIWDPIFKTSRGYAIGRRWLDKFYTDVFNTGYVVRRIDDGSTVKCPIPRYYEKWFKKFHFEKYIEYLVDVKNPMLREIARLDEITQKTHRELNGHNPYAMSRAEVKNYILKDKIKKLNSLVKL